LRKVITVLSGGMDSTLTAYKMRKEGYKLIPLHFSYGQRTEDRELKAFHEIADSLKVENRYVIPLNFFKDIGVGVTSLIDSGLDLNEAGVDDSEIPNSYVPFRNGIMLSIATAIAEKEGAVGISIGVVEEASRS
jgi:7-cyano-7-deazaguanine synthase